MGVSYKNEWYFWHYNYPDYEERMAVMSVYAKSYFCKYAVENLLKLVTKD